MLTHKLYRNDLDFHSTNAPPRYSPNLVEENLHPQLLIAGSGHHWDSYALGSVKNISLEPMFIQNAHLWEIRTVQRWIEDCKFCIRRFVRAELLIIDKGITRNEIDDPG